ncbi:MAG: hypothetical protein ACXAC5_16055 [Promethearchaeota archaeon]|jgi:hypothetical protein
MENHKRSVYYIILALLVLSFFLEPNFAAEFEENLIKNGSFEKTEKAGDIQDWKIVPAYKGKGEAVLEKKDAYAGNYSLKLTPNKKNKSGAFGVYQMLEYNTMKGKEITISGFVRVDGKVKNAAILFGTDKQNWIPLPKNTKKKFVPFNKTLKISQSIPKAALLLLISGKKGSVWFDDLSLKKTTNVSLKREPFTTRKEIDKLYVDRINTPGWQDSVYIRPDGKELYFAYLPYVQKDFFDLFFGRITEKDIKQRGPIRPGSHGMMNFETYVARRNKDGTWSRPINLNINSTYSIYSAKLSHDGKELYYAIRNFEENYGADDIYVSKKLSDGNWGPPKNLGPNINTEYREDTPCLTADGKTMYFGRNKREMFGWKIMVSKKVNGKWSKAKKMEKPINQGKLKKTANYQPFITADGNEFYFTRIQQLYVSKKKPDGSWGKPKKVFPNLAVSGHASVTDDGRFLYLLTAKDKNSLKRGHFTIWYSERQKNGAWGEPKPVD